MMHKLQVKFQYQYHIPLNEFYNLEVSFHF